MPKITRRALLGATPVFPLFGLIGCGKSAARRATDIRVVEMETEYEEYVYRAPFKFGGRVVDRCTILNVKCTVHDKNARAGRGFGSMPLSNPWSFPSATMTYETTLGAMTTLAARILKLTADHREFGHPVDINCALEKSYLKAAGQVSAEMKLDAPIPKLCTLNTASPFDAAIHDAFGKLHGLNCYRTYGREFMAHDLSRYLGPDYGGEYLGQYVTQEPKPRMPLYHLVGALDPITPGDIDKRIGDGLPETLSDWIVYNGLTHLKIKLNGNDLAWDVDRVLRVDRTATETAQDPGSLRYSADFNEKCLDVQYLLDFLHRIREKSPSCFDRIQYIEQPTARDLQSNRSNVMHEAAKLRPVVIDESLTDVESLLLARDMGYTGVALKACKGQSQALLMAAAAQKHKMFLCVQDLTCPGASLIHSAGLAAHVPGVAAVEANARQYVPAANRAWEERLPGVFRIKDGMIDTRALNGPGLSIAG